MGRISARILGRPVEDDEAPRPPADDRGGRRGGTPVAHPIGPPAPSGAPPTTSPDSHEVTQIWLNEVRPLFEAKTGECTQWAYEKRPDIVERADRFTSRGGSTRAGPMTATTLAMSIASAWADGARAAGLPVDQSPAAGALLVEPGNPGHVAYVEAVDEFGAYFQVTEMNAPDRGVVTTRTIDMAAVAAEGLQFIH